MQRFEGKVALVSGGGGGIGGAVARRLTAAGATVVGLDLGPGDGLLARASPFGASRNLGRCPEPTAPNA